MDVYDPAIQGSFRLSKGMLVDFPKFNPQEFEVEFPFFDPLISKNLEKFGDDALVGREVQVNDVNKYIDHTNTFEKYRPIICTASRSMGKTAFLEAIGLQAVKEELKNKLILDAIATGRILSFDFAKSAAETAIPEQKDIKTFFTRLMVYFLCLMFDGNQVDGICFQFVEFNTISKFRGKQREFNSWKQDFLQLGCDKMIDEYIRLTNIAFNVNIMTPPVFLLDGIQLLCKPTTIESKFTILENTPVYHSFLSFLLIQLAGKHKPICICAGTSHGDLLKITGGSPIIPGLISLST